MIRFFYLSVLFLCLFLNGFSQQRNNLITCDIPGYNLVKSNDTDNFIGEFIYQQTAKMSYLRRICPTFLFYK